ncbi:hypothetical protein G6F29_011592 [Rhizopus arrhizus]|nr:hypothetical protein G6F30_005056 [Rhizopus arrhizus]KAG0975351.1 hypothetical protein G6F29_011592 [Rhizopus arrhizus]KAG1009571.1 hypothetical protein G6F27_005467 [Rhizopus arrhizus]KAG1070773.1 hypothetical protein G6F41_004903 [Rhizopus arrhizus]KAG1098786.1 hypothetical protein G6F39_005140 [Rhizopus arrhizus]
MRTHGRAATEIFEQLSILREGKISTEEAHTILEEAFENAKRLAVFAWAQGRQQDEEARDFAIKALRLPSNLKHLETKESGKREAFSTEFIEQYHEAKYQQSVLRAATTNNSQGNGRGGHSNHWNQQHRGGRESNSSSTSTGTIPQPTKQLQQLPTTLNTQHYTTPMDGILPGGRLHHFLHSWKSITTHPWPISIIQHGYRIQFAKQPTPWKIQERRLSAEDQLHVNAAVQKFLDGGIIEISPSQNRNFLSKFFTLQEKTKRRPILDCKQLNQFLQVEHFKMEGVPALREIIEKDDYLCKIDLKDAYVVVPIHPESQDFLSFQNQGIVYRYTSLAFGLSVASRVFSKIMRHAIEPLRKEGIRLVYYSDDICIMAKTKPEMNLLTRRIRIHLEKLGFIINYAKSSLGPVKSQEFLGFQFKTKIMEISVPREALLHIRYLQRDLASSLQQTHQDWEAICKLSSTSQEELHWWENFVCQKNGLPIQKIAHATPKVIIHVDASNTGWGISSPLVTTSGFWTQEEVQQSINVRELKTILFAIQLHARKCENSTIKIFSDNMTALKYTTKSGGTASEVLQDLAIRIQELSQQHTSGYVEQNKKTPLRITNSEKDVQQDSTTMGPTTTGCIRSETQQTTSKLLVTSLGSGSDSGQRLSAELEDKGTILVPAMEANPTCLETSKGAEIETSGIGDPFMAEPVLVPNDPEDETHRFTNNLETEQQMVFSRMAIIHNYRVANGLDGKTIQFLNKKIRTSTQRMYDTGWIRWTAWCQDNNKKALEYNPRNVLAFLVDHQHYSSNHLNTLRSAIASVFTIIHEQQTPIADQPIIKDFFAAKRKSNVSIPKKHQLFTWDIAILINYIKDKLTPTVNLSLQQLQLKTILLLCMATMWRPRSDIGRLQFRDIHIQRLGETTSATIHAREPKECQVKSVTLGEYKEEQLCPVKTLVNFLHRTANTREDLPVDHTLFLTYLEKEEIRSSSVRPTTVANWIKAAMQAAGIDTTNFQAHSIRLAASTKAVELGHSIQDVKKHANWSLQSNTFEDFYYKPSSQASSSTAINNSTFSSTENSITLEVGVESTGISLGTTSNTNVDETKTENVIHTRPWYRSFW